MGNDILSKQNMETNRVMTGKANFKPNNFAAIHLTENKYLENIKNSSSALLCECGEEPWSCRTGGV